MSKVIYTRVYPQNHTLPKNTDKSGIFSELSDEELNRLLDECEYRIIPERVEESKKFIELAIRYSEESKTSLEIKQGDDYISVCYYFISLLSYGEKKDNLAELIKKSDTLNIYLPTDCENKTIKLILSFNTHECYKRWEFG